MTATTTLIVLAVIAACVIPALLMIALLVLDDCWVRAQSIFQRTQRESHDY